MNAEVKALVDLEFGKLDTKVTELNNAIKEEIASFGSMGEKNTQALDTLNKTVEETVARVLELEQGSGSEGGAGEAIKSVGEQFVESDSFGSFVAGNATKATLEITNNTITGSDTTVAPDRRGGVVPGATRRLRVEQAMPGLDTTSNAIEYVKENVFTNNADAQNGEGSELPETSITFSLVNDPVATIGHWLKVSKQMMSDAPALAAYINGRLGYGVDLKVDTALIRGDGAAGDLSGLTAAGNFTTFTPTASDSALVSVRKAITQLEVAEYFPNAVMLNPAQVEELDLTAATTEEFIAANPRMAIQPMVWGLPIISSNAVVAGQFVIGAFDLACMVHRRQGTIVEMSESDDDNFTKNLVTVKASRRLALEVNTPAAILAGALTA